MCVVRSYLCISGGTILFWQQNLNITDQWTIKRNALIGSTVSPSRFLFFHFFFLSPLRFFSILIAVNCKQTLMSNDESMLCYIAHVTRCSVWLNTFFLVFSEDIAGESFSGKMKMWLVKACWGRECRGKWSANALLSLQWHYKWLPMWILITLGRMIGGIWGRASRGGDGIVDGNNQGA